tara:strand:+ start:1235 stop:3055 length:1821 start_codon:yes stop_codon:yes gene_type:complete
MQRRSERDEMLWKQQLAAADPSRRRKEAGEIEGRIVKLHELKAKMAREDQKAKQEILSKYMEEAGKDRRARWIANTRQSIAKSGVLKQAYLYDMAWINKQAPVKAKKQITSTIESMTTNLSTYMSKAAERREAKQANKWTEVDEGTFNKRLASLAYAWRSGVNAGSDESTTEEGPIGLKKFWLYAWSQAGNILEEREGGILSRINDLTPDDLKKAEGSLEDIERLRSVLIAETNRAKSGDPTKDIWKEYEKEERFGGQATRMQLDILGGVGGGTTVPSPEDLEKITGGAKAQEAVQSIIDGLVKRLDVARGRESRAEEEFQYLLRGGGMYKRPSRVGDRMYALGRMRRAEPSLAEAVDIGEVTYPEGTGGNLSDFLKTKIGQYRTTPGDASVLMDQVVKAVNLYGDTLGEDDTIDDYEMFGQRPGKTIRDLVDIYSESVEAKPAKKGAFADVFMKSLSDKPTNITRDYGGLEKMYKDLAQETDSREERRAMRDYADEYAHRAEAIPKRFNVSTVLNPYIENVLNASESGNDKATYEAMGELYSVVDDPDLDELLGSAGMNIRGALSDMNTSIPEIGLSRAISRGTSHLRKAYEDFASQTVDGFGEG